MDDEDKKPLVPEDGVDESKPDQEADETKVEVKTSTDETDSVADDTHEDKGDEIDITAALKGDSVTFDEEESTPEEEVSDFDRELDRVEGIEGTASVASAAKDTAEDGVPEIDDEAKSFDPATPVDLDEATKGDEHGDALAVAKPKEDAASAAFVSALKQQDQKDATKKSKAGLLAGLLAVLVLAAAAGAVYFYLQWNDTRDQLSGVESSLSSEQAKNSTLVNQLAELSDEEDAVADALLYVDVPEFGVRYKSTDDNQNLIYSYLGATSEGSKTIGFTTVALADIREGQGTNLRNSCATNGLGMITRYDDGTRELIGGTVSEFGKKVGDYFYVFATPQSVCTTQVKASELEAMTAQVKAIYESLEVIPADDEVVDGDAAAETTPADN